VLLYRMIQGASDAREFQVLLAAGDKGLNRVFGSFLTNKAGRVLPPLRLHTLEGSSARSLRGIVEGRQFDLCTLVLNNIIFGSEVYECSEPREARLQGTLNLVRDLVNSYSIQVIALYGWPDDPDYPERVKAAGASVVIRLPFDLDDLPRVVSDILTRRAGLTVQNTIPDEWARRQERLPAEPGDPPTSD
jgi:hypothetical protein